MSYLYSDGNLMNNTESILQIMKAQQAEKRVFGNSVLAEVSNDSFTKTTNPVDKKTSVNNADDGKISFKEKITNFGKGLIAPVKNMFSSPKNIAITALSVAGGAALIAITGGAAAPVMVAAGLIGGGVQIGKGIYKQANATTDEQARQAWQQMGSGTFTVAVSAAGAKSALKANGVDVKGMSTLKAGAKCIVEAPKNVVRGVSTASGKISAFMSSTSTVPETSSIVTGSETSSKAPKKTTVDTPETVVDVTSESVAEAVEAPVEPVIETPEIETSAPIKKTVTTEVKTTQAPAETPEIQMLEQPTTVVEPSTTINSADSSSTPVNVEVPETVAPETRASTPKPAPKKVAEPKNYVQEILLPSGRIIKVDTTPKSYSEMLSDKYKMKFDKAKAQEKVSILNKLKDIFKVFGFFKPKKV